MAGGAVMKKSQSMVALAQEYLHYRRQLGFKLQVQGWLLLKFAQYADQSGHRGPITTDLAVQWAKLPPDASAKYHADRLAVVRCFAGYRAMFDARTQIPPPDVLKRPQWRPQPYIYSDVEIAHLMRAAQQLQPSGGLRPQSYSVLFGLLISAGLRVSEALRLGRNEVDLRQGLLTIIGTKFQKSRLVPLHPSATEQLSTYTRFRDQYHPLPDSDTFLLAERGGVLPYSTVRHTFQLIRDQLGWKAGRSGRPPRIHDLRHTFACHRLLQWHRDGVDVDHAIASLATYLGHVSVMSTYWYLTAIPELMEIAVQRFERFGNSKNKEQ